MKHTLSKISDTCYLFPAIPDGDISCCEYRFFEIQDQEANDIYAFRVVSHFRRSSKYELDGQVKLDV